MFLRRYSCAEQMSRHREEDADSSQ